MKTLVEIDTSLPEQVDKAIGQSSPADRTTLLSCSGSDDECSRTMRYGAVARACVRHLASELGLSTCGELPDRIECGHLRSAVRSVFPPELPVHAELSFKSVQKLERGCCQTCRPMFDEKLSEWKRSRFEPQDVDPDHLRRFVDVFRRNVPRGWNRHKYPYIPNGRGSLWNSRKEGGNWNVEGFDDFCRPTLVFSSGKPRVVTLFSSHNTSVLYPLHMSLFHEIRRRGWLLVGPPTARRVADLNGDGDFLSFDYVGATDSFKTAYVQAAIEALIDLGEDLSDDEKRCLRVLGELRLEPGGEIATRGQPMGSVMSFPLLCLFNKTVVDLSLIDLLEVKKIRFKEYSGHRCLINGDDLLLREPRKGKSLLYSKICSHGSKVGMEVNKEKSLVSADIAEINSTSFYQCVEEKKVNASALYMRPQVGDVLGYAAQATRSPHGFRRVVRANTGLLRNQHDKGLDLLPNSLIAVCRKDNKIRKALTAVPPDPGSSPDANFFTVDRKPADYGLTRDEEVAAAESHREKVRESAIEYYSTRQKRRYRKADSFTTVSFRSLLKRKRPTSEEMILRVYSLAWEEKKKKRLVEEEGVIPSLSRLEGLPPSDLRPAFAIRDAISAWRLTRKTSVENRPFEEEDFISFDD